MERLDATRQGALKAHLGPFHPSVAGTKSDDHMVTTTNADGSKDIDNSFTTGDRGVAYDEHLDPTGKATSEKLTLVLKNHDAVDSLLALIPNLKPSAKATEFRYELTRAQVEALYVQAQRAATALKKQAVNESNDGLSHHPLIAMLAASKGADEFFWNFPRYCPNAFAEAELLSTISDASLGLAHDQRRAPLPGKLT